MKNIPDCGEFEYHIRRLVKGYREHQWALQQACYPFDDRHILGRSDAACILKIIQLSIGTFLSGKRDEFFVKQVEYVRDSPANMDQSSPRTHPLISLRSAPP